MPKPDKHGNGSAQAVKPTRVMTVCTCSLLAPAMLYMTPSTHSRLSSPDGSPARYSRRPTRNGSMERVAMR